MTFHHIGVACSNIETTLQKIRNLHPNILEISEILHDPLQEVDLCMVSLQDGLQLELVSGKPIQKFLDSKNSFYHICYEVEDITKSIAHFTANSSVLISPPKPAILFNNRHVCFLLTPYGIVELLEK